MGCRLWGRAESDTTEVTAAAAAGIFLASSSFSGSFTCGHIVPVGLDHSRTFSL